MPSLDIPPPLRVSSKARKNDERVTTILEIPDTLLSTNLFP